MILWFSLIACVLASLYLPLLGKKVLNHRIIFIDWALAQVAAVGYAVGLASDGNGLVYASIITALAILLIAAMPAQTDVPKEGMMGALYALSASVGMMVLASMPHAEGQMMALLFGSMLGVDETELLLLLVSGSIALVLMRLHDMESYVGRVIFYTSLACAVVPAIYALGVVLVFSLLVVPGLAVWRHGQVGSSVLAIGIAITGSVSGVMLSNYYDYPPSSAVVVFLCLYAVMLRVGVSYKTKA